MLGKERINKCAPYGFLVLASLLMALFAETYPFSSEVTGTDSSVFIYVARAILDGEMPYLDTFDHKGPILYLINVLGLVINDWVGIWLLEYVTIYITFLYTYKIARLLGCCEISACAVVATNILVLNYYFQGGNLTEEYACCFITISLYLFLEYFITAQTTAWKLILCGISFAAVLMLRVNMIVLWAVMCIGVLIYNIKNGTAKNVIGFIAWFLLGASVVCVPVLLWLWKNHALVSFVDSYLLFNLSYASDPTTASLGAIARAVVYFCEGSPVILATPILVYFCISKKNLMDWLCVFALGLSLASICMSGRQYGHYGMILCPLVVYAVSRVLAELDAKLFMNSKIKRKQKNACILTSFCVVMLLFLKPIGTMARDLSNLSSGTNAAMELRQIAEVVKENTSEDDAITVCGNRDVIYLLSDRKSASKYSYQTPIGILSPDIRAEYLDDIRQLKAKMILLTEDYFLYDDIMAVVAQDYSQIQSIGTTQVYIRNF